MKRLVSLPLALVAAVSAAGAETVSLSSLDLSLAQQGWNKPQADKSVEGRPLTVNGKHFDKGFGTHSVSDLYIDLKGGSERFTAMVGLDDEQNGSGSVEFAVFGDDKLLWRSGLMLSKQGPKAVDVPLAGIKQLVLHVTDGGDGTGNDHADWCDASLVVGGAKPVAIPVPAGKTHDLPAPPASVQTYMTRGPKGYTATLFAKPPEVSYPVCIATGGTGELFVSVDANGSLDKAPHRGKIVRLIDSDGDGVADRADAFVPDVDSPRGIYFDGATLYCLHPPTITAYTDTDGDGKADKAVDLVTGIGYGLDKHPADHTSNGIREAIDGWLYLAIGDFGVPDAVGKDGQHLTHRGGGVLRVRPDGTELEVFAYHTRNIMDVSQDPLLDGFIYDNTNDGDGWNSRMSYAVGGADMGYPSLYQRFERQLLPTLHDFGGGSAVGTLYLHEPKLPEGDGDAQFICDWGTSWVYRLPLKADGAGWSLDSREEWARVERVTDMDVDGSQHLYLSSWKGAVFTNAGPNVGAIIQLTPEGGAGARFPDLKKAADADLVKDLASRSAVMRQQSQHEILRRGPKPAFKSGITELAQGGANPLYARVAAIFTLAQLYGAESHPTLIALAKDASVQEWALRALADRRTQLKDVPSEPFLAGLASANPRVRVQALIGLGRLGRPENAKAIVPLTAVGADAVGAALIIPHCATRALRALKAADACLEAITPGSSPEQLAGALWALKWIHEPRTVEGLVAKLAGATPELRKQIYDALAHLYYDEGEWNREAWWTTRPEHSGPYFQRAAWAGTPAAEAALKAAIAAGGELGGYVAERVAFYKLKIEGLALADAGRKPQAQNDAELLAKARAAQAKVEGKVIGNLKYEDVVPIAATAKGDAKLGEQLFARQGCIACHTVSKDVPQKGPYLGEIAKQYSRLELIESILKPNAKIAQGFATRWFDLKDGQHLEGFVTSEGAETITLRNIIGIVTEIRTDDIAKRGEGKNSMMPEGLANNLKPEELASLLAYFEALSAGK
jgi:putative heme-binding domain-containing protein